MTQRSSRQAKNGLFVIGLLIIAGIVYLTVNSSEWSVYADSGSTSENRGADQIFASADNSQIEPYYQETLKQWQADGIQPGTGKVVIPASQFTAKSDDADAMTGSYEGKNNVLIWSNQRGWIEYEVEVSRAGLYEMKADYYPLKEQDGGSRQSVMLSARINGEYPFNESRSIVFEREYRDIQPARYDALGNQIRPQVEEVTGWKEKALTESNGAYSTPIQWYLKQGKKYDSA